MNADEYLLNRSEYMSGTPRIIHGTNNIDELHVILRDLGLTTGVEVGVDMGRHAARMFKNIPGLKLYGVDKWVTYEGYRQHKTQERMNNRKEEAYRILQGLNCELIEDWSLDAVKRFEDNSLDFVFIDANHEFRHVIDDIDEWGRKVKKGGILCGHDCMDFRVGGETVDVYHAVPAWARAKGIDPWYLVTGYNGPIWLWVKK